MSTSENPAAPFYFVMAPIDGRYQIHGEGTGNKQASDAAGEELSRLTQDEIGALLAAARAGASAKPK